MMKLSVPIVITMVLISGIGIGLAYIATIETSNISMDSTIDVSYCTIDVNPTTCKVSSSDNSKIHYISDDGYFKGYSLKYAGVYGSAPVDGMLNVQLTIGSLTASSTVTSCVLHAVLECADSQGNSKDLNGSVSVSLSETKQTYQISGLGPLKQSDSDHKYTLSLYIETDSACELTATGLSMILSVYPLEGSA